MGCKIISIGIATKLGLRHIPNSRKLWVVFYAGKNCKELSKNKKKTNLQISFSSINCFTSSCSTCHEQLDSGLINVSWFTPEIYPRDLLDSYWIGYTKNFDKSSDRLYKSHVHHFGEKKWGGLQWLVDISNLWLHNFLQETYGERPLNLRDTHHVPSATRQLEYPLTEVLQVQSFPPVKNHAASSCIASQGYDKSW